MVQDSGSAPAQRKASGPATVTVQLAQTAVPLSAMPSQRQAASTCQENPQQQQQQMEPVYWGRQLGDANASHSLPQAAPASMGAQPIWGQGSGVHMGENPEELRSAQMAHDRQLQGGHPAGEYLQQPP